MKEQKKVLTVGVFDYFHLGHLNVLKKAKKHGDYLIAAVHNDKLNIKGVRFLYTLEQRLEFVNSIKYVDEAITYERVDTLVERVDFDVFVHGPDQEHKYFQKAFQWCKDHDKKIITLDRTEGISSTQLRKHIAQLD